MHLYKKAVKTILYVQNHTPHRVLEKKSPKEDFSWEKPEVNHLRIFGCLVYIHIPKENKTNLDPYGRKGTFIGYNDTSKAYRIYFLGFKNINISRDVKFDEDSTYFRSKKLPIVEVEEPEAKIFRDTRL